jgi:hypothetical protein
MEIIQSRVFSAVTFNPFTMKQKSTRYFSVLLCFIFPFTVGAQCPVGTTQAELNWDNLDFLPSNNARYSPYYPSTAFPYTQNFAMGPRTLNFVIAPQANITLNGENGLNTAHAGSFATAGDDVQFTTTSSVTVSTIIMTFDINVSNMMFSVFDLDVNQRMNITATNLAGVAQTITIVKANAASGITIAGSGTVSATATGPGVNFPNGDNNGTLNVTIAGPVRRVVVTLSNAVGDLWLSDIDACITGTFPNNYQNVSRPFTGQPQYVLAVCNNNIYYVDPTNGRGYFLFNEPGHDRLNSMAYDPYRRVVYYTYSLTDRVGLNPQNDKVLKKYDVDTKTISVVLPNVNTIGIPTYESGVESGAASFYNGSLYLGIEGYTGSNYAASRKSTIWKINFDAAGNAVGPASQVFGVTADDGVASQNIHDWSDFGISNGILTDFDGSQSGDIDYYSFNMFTGVSTNYIPVGGVIPRQVSIGWDERLYNVDAAISLYNGTNGVGPLITMTAPLGPTMPTGSAASWGDAAGPYRPFLDFGDAPASYDPDPWSPACHDTLAPTVAGRRTQLRLGPAEDVEWLKRGLTTVEDNFEDALSTVPVFDPAAGSYTCRLTTFNNTGANATIIGWLDFNGNGVFDAGEASAPLTVPSSTLTQTVDLYWASTPSTLVNGTYTHLRIRITTASYGMNATRATGYYDMGEVEDYRVLVDNFPLSVSLISFDASVFNKTAVSLTWVANEDIDFSGYEVQRSNNLSDWEVVTYVPASHNGGENRYSILDNSPYTGKSWYRLKLKDKGVADRYSEVRMVTIKRLSELITISPNPAFTNDVTLTIMKTGSGTAQLRIIGMHGATLHDERLSLTPGLNNLRLPLQTSWPNGTYLVQVISEGEVATKKLVINR